MPIDWTGQAGWSGPPYTIIISFDEWQLTFFACIYSISSYCHNEYSEVVFFIVVDDDTDWLLIGVVAFEWREGHDFIKHFALLRLMTDHGHIDVLPPCSILLSSIRWVGLQCDEK